MQDTRIGYVEVQIDRAMWDEIQKEAIDGKA
jgi:hypothetical protein